MDPKTQEQINELEVKVDAILSSVKKAEKYFRWMFWITVVVFVLPLLAMMFVVPSLIDSYTSTLNGLI